MKIGSHSAYSGPETIAFSDAPIPSPAAAEVLIRVRRPGDAARKFDHTGRKKAVGYLAQGLHLGAQVIVYGSRKLPGTLRPNRLARVKGVVFRRRPAAAGPGYDFQTIGVCRHVDGSLCPPPGSQRTEGQR